MSIKVTYFSNFFIGGSPLTEATRRKLIALGIDPSTVTSEAEAKNLIEKVQNKLQVLNKPQTTSGKTVCTSECEILTKAKNLAKKLGITVSDNATIEEILSTLSSKITQIAANEPQKTINFQSELDSLKSEYSTIKQNQNSIYTQLNMTASINKFMLGL